MRADFHVQLCENFADEQIVRVSQGDQVEFLPFKRFAGSGNAGILLLAELGIVAVGKAETERVMKNIMSAASGGETNRVIDTVGWNGPHFALPTGQVISPSDVSPPETTFRAPAGRCAESGKLKDWLTNVAEPQAGHSIAMFATCLSFMSSILRLTGRVENVGFELVGAGGIGKTTVQRLAASVVGRPTAEGGESYVVSADTTLNAFERTMTDHSDLPLIIDEANLLFAGESDSKRADVFKALAFKLDAGTAKERLTEERARPPVRFAYLLSTNQALASMLGRRSEAATAATHRLISIPIGADRPFGIFDRLPDGFESSGAFAAALGAAARAHYGKAFVRFMRRLAQARADDEPALRATIQKHVARFAANARINANSGADVRVAEAFGLVYAAGALAQSYGALPASWNVGKAVLAVYRIYREGAALPPPFDQRLVRLAGSKRVVPANSKQARRATRVGDDIVGVIRVWRGNHQLLIPSDRIEEVFIDWHQLENDTCVRSLMHFDRGRLTVKTRLIEGGKHIRVYCFNLPRKMKARPR